MAEDCDEEIKIQRVHSSIKTAPLNDQFTFERFIERQNNMEPKTVAYSLINEMNSIASQTFERWHALIDTFCKQPQEIHKYLMAEYTKNYHDKLGEKIFSVKVAASDFAFPNEDHTKEINKVIAKKQR